MDKRKKILFIFILSAGFIFLSSSAWLIHIRIKEIKQKKLSWSLLEEKIKQEAVNSGFEEGIVIKDLSTGWRISINEKKLFPAASLVKLPIMTSLFSMAEGEGLDLKEEIVLTNKNKALGSGILKNYCAGSAFNIENLIEIMIVESDNTATNMLINNIGFEAFNVYFKRIGLNDTNLSRKMMDFKSRKIGLENFTTAGDFAYLLEKIYRKKLVNKDYSQRCLAILKKQKIRDRIPALLPVDTVVAHKTGLEKGICHDTGIVFTPEGDFLICVLTRHNYNVSRLSKRFIAKISRQIYDFYQPAKDSSRAKLTKNQRQRIFALVPPG